jgi:hypothetical protein
LDHGEEEDDEEPAASAASGASSSDPGIRPLIRIDVEGADFTQSPDQRTRKEFQKKMGEREREFEKLEERKIPIMPHFIDKCTRI